MLEYEEGKYQGRLRLEAVSVVSLSHFVSRMDSHKALVTKFPCLVHGDDDLCRMQSAFVR